MSNYPPPQYGLPYNPNEYMAPSAGAYNGGVSQYPYQSQTNAAYLHGQVQSSGVSPAPPAPHTNAYLFNANAQRVISPSNRVNGNFSGYGNQQYSHALPPPPYPPVPISFGTSHFPQPPAPTNSAVPSIHAHLASEPPHPRSPIKHQSTQAVDSRDVVSAESDLEDGEVDDEESDKPSNTSVSNEMGFTFSRSSQNEEYNSAVANLSSSLPNMPEYIPSSQLQGDHFQSCYPLYQ